MKKVTFVVIHLQGTYLTNYASLFDHDDIKR